MIRSEHIVQFRVTSKDGRRKHDNTFHNFAFSKGLELFGKFFDNEAGPATLWLGLIGGGGTVSVEFEGNVIPDLGYYYETTVNLDLALTDPDNEIPRQQWIPSVASWDDGDFHGFEVTGSVQWTATGFTTTVPPTRDGGGNILGDVIQSIVEGVIMFADSGIVEQYLANPPIGSSANFTYPTTNPLFAAIGATRFDTDYNDDEAAGVADSLIAYGDTIDVTYTIRFAVEDVVDV